MKGNRWINGGVGLVLLMLATVTYGQSCNNAVTATAPDSRYQDNGDGTVSDLYTGLMWQRCSGGQSGSDCASGSANTFTWDLALQQPQTVNSGGGFAGYTDWRLPDSKELESLVEEACWSPAINVTFFPNTLNAWYWSSSPSADSSDYAWVVSFDNGNAYGSNRSSSFHVRLVRSGQ